MVRVGETTDRQGLVTVRSSAPFRPLPLASSLSEQIHFGEPVLLLRAPFRLSFAYAGQDRVWKGSWHDADKLPAAIKLTIRDAASERILAISTATPVHVDAPAQGDCARPDGNCDGKPAAQNNPQGGVQGNPQGNPQGNSQPMGNQGGRQ